MSMPSELETLRREFNAGKYASIPADLERFLANHAKRIRGFRDRELALLPPGPDRDELAIKLYILQIRSINPIAEIGDEMEEVRREVWYKAEEAGHAVDSDEVAREWCARHAPGWRDHRVLAIIYSLEKGKAHYLNIIRDAP